MGQAFWLPTLFSSYLCSSRSYMIGWLGYVFFRLLIALFAMLPFSWLYRLSDGLSWLLYAVVRHRRKTVYDNLRRVFPDWSDEQRQHVARLSYTNFSDILLEAFKGFSLSTEELAKRYKCRNIEVLTAYYERGQSVIAVLAHYANWEWGLMHLSTLSPFLTIAIYKPLSNAYLDRYLRNRREQYGAKLATTRTTSQTFERYRSARTLTLMGTDQNPSSWSKAIWVTFLNQPTACVTGPKNTPD